MEHTQSKKRQQQIELLQDSDNTTTTGSSIFGGNSSFRGDRKYKGVGKLIRNSSKPKINPLDLQNVIGDLSGINTPKNPSFLET
jgi:hypothetical protein